jgi:hypothetical protein
MDGDRNVAHYRIARIGRGSTADELYFTEGEYELGNTSTYLGAGSVLRVCF